MAKKTASGKTSENGKNYFDPISSNPNFSEMEERILARWDTEDLLSKYLKKNKSSDRYFSFLDGPITANNPMGVHHAWGRTYKDLWQRYKNMQGFRQRFQNGFDCQGLWVEVEVEKELGLKSKKDIENLVPGDRKASIEKFVQLCRDRVKKYSDIQTQQSQRLGYFMDWEHSYFTLSEDNNYMIWHFLKKCYEKGLIYKGRDSVPWCPRCQTSISQHEILTEDYKEVTHQSIFFRLPLKNTKNEYLLVWTTTPWTIPANVAVAVDADKDYVKTQAEDDPRYYWILSGVAERLKLKVIETKKGSELVGMEYEAPFDQLPRIIKSMDGQPHKVVASDPMILPISGEEGTGLVHIAPGAGAEDFALGKKLNLASIEVIDEEANYLSDMDKYSGQNAKKHPELIIDYLKQKEEGAFLFQVLPYKHRYPACWRCKTELVWRVVDEWYIAIDPVREDMKRVTEKIRWIPEFGKARELDWLKNMHDWLISKKNRYWGLALPIWECSNCGNFEVIGSHAELKERAIEGWEKFEGHTPHKPFVDEVKIKCGRCDSTMSRIEPVGNPWLDAGIVAYSTVSENNKAANFEKTDTEPLYISNKSQWEKWIPADFITESFPGQFKNWFYSLIAMSTVLENKEPFKTVLGYATQLAEDGRPMHKSWGNSIEFNEGAEKIGADVMRWMFARQNPAENLLFGYKIGDEVRRQFHLKIWNTYNYFITYANLDSWKPSGETKTSDNILDRWVLMRLSETLSVAEKSLDAFDSASAAISIEEFVDDLSNWYVRRSRGRTGFTSTSEEDKNSFYNTLYDVLVTLVKLLAPFTPYISDEIFRNLTKEESVHLTSWPVLEVQKEKGLIVNMRIARQICEIAHSLRKEKGLAVRQPLLELKTNIPDMGKGIEIIIKDEVNVKKIKWGNSSLSVAPEVELDLNISPELVEEAKTRELIRNIQAERKNLNVSLTDVIQVNAPWLPENPELLDLIKKTTVTSTLSLGEFKVETGNDTN